MAEGTLRLPIAGAAMGDGSSGNEFPDVYMLTSVDSNDPKHRAFVAGFDETTEEFLSWSFRVPDNYASAGKIKALFFLDSMGSSGEAVVWRACLQCVTPDSDADDMEALDPPSAGGWAEDVVSVDAGSNLLMALEIDLSSNLDGMAAGDAVALIFSRNAGDSQDSADGYAILWAEIQFIYTTT